MISILKGYIQDLAKVLGNIEKGNLNVTTNQNYQGNFIEMKNSIDNIIISLNIKKYLKFKLNLTVNLKSNY